MNNLERIKDNLLIIEGKLDGCDGNDFNHVHDEVSPILSDAVDRIEDLEKGIKPENYARLFATAAHTAIDQQRKYTGEPYINHPKAVVEILKTIPHTTEMICAAWLHDVVEDTNVTIDIIKEHFGDLVAQYVDELTDISSPSDGNREFRKNLDLAHTANASNEAKTIKLADLIHNTSSIVKHDTGFAEIYLAEKRRLLEVLREGNKELWQTAHDLCKQY